jgi:hypothetical protein
MPPKRRGRKKKMHASRQVSPRAFGMYRHVLRGTSRNIIAKNMDMHLLPRKMSSKSAISVMRPKKIVIG